MSKTVDERIVEMRFDNAQFEKNVATSMSTLDKLKQKLKLSDASKGFENINSAAKKVDMNGLSSGIEVVSAKFSALQVMGVTALANITNSAVDAGKKFVSALTTDPVKDGFTEYETQMNAVQTILANTQKEGATIKQVNTALDKLNTYADKTIYNFTEMTRNIGTFTAAGVKLDTSVSSIKGIANLAAVSGSTSMQASTAMYQLSQAIAAGAVKLQDWNSVVNAGMGGQVFQDALIRTSENLQTGAKSAIEASGSFRESLKDGWITTEVLTQTLDQFATAAETQKEYEDAVKKFIDQGYTQEEAKQMADMARTAGQAATKVKTFSQLIDTLKEAMGSGWTRTWQLVIGDFEEARNMWSKVSDVLSNVINKYSDARNILVESALGKGFSKLTKKINAISGPAEKAMDSVNKAVEAVSNFDDIVTNVIRGNYGNGQERFNALSEAGENYYRIQNKVNETLGNSYRYTEEQIKAQDELLGTQSKAADGTEAETDGTVKLTKEKKKLIKEIANMSEEQMKAAGYSDKQIKAFRQLREAADKIGMPLDKFINKMDKITGRWLLLNSFKNMAKALVRPLKAIGGAWQETFKPVTAKNLFNVIAGFHKFTASLIMSKDNAEKLKRTFKGLFAAIDIIRTVAGNGLSLAFKAVSAVLKAFDLNILDVTANIGDAIVKFRDFLFSNDLINKGFQAFAESVKMVVTVLKSLFDAFMNLPTVQKGLNKIKEGFEKLKDMDLSEIGPNLINKFKNINWGEVGQYAVAKIREGFGMLKEVNLVEVGKNIIQGLRNGLSDGVNVVPELLITIGKNIVEAIKGVLGIHSPSTVMFEIGKNVIQGLINGLREGLSKVIGFIKSLGSSIVQAFGEIGSKVMDILGDVDWNKVIAVSVIAGILVAIKNVKDTVDKFAAPFEGLGSIFSSVGKVIEDSNENIQTILENTGKVVGNFAKVLKAQSFKISASAIKDLAISIGILVASIYVIAQLDVVKVWNAVGVIAVLAVILGVLSFALAEINKASITIGENGLNVSGLKTGLIGLGVVLLMMAAVVKIIGNMDRDQAIQGFLGLITMVGLLAGVFAAYGYFVKGKAAQNIDKAAIMMKKMAVAMLLMAVVCKLIGSLSESDMLKGGIFMVAFGVFTAAMLWASKKFAQRSVDKIGSMMVKMAVAMGLMVAVCKLAGKLSDAEMFKGALFAAGFVVFVRALVKATTISSDAQIAQISGLLMSISVSMMLMVGVCKLAGLLNENDMVKGAFFAVGFVVFVAALVSVLKIGNEQEIAKVSGTILAVSVAIGVLAGVCILLGMIDLGSLTKGVIAVGLLGVLMIGLIRSTKGAADVKGSIIAMAVAIGVMAAAVVVLSMIKTSDLAKGVAAVVALGVILSLMIRSTRGATDCMKNLIVMTAAIAVMAGAIVALSFVDGKKLAGATVALGTLMAMFALMEKASASATGSMKTILALTLVVGALAGILYFISSMPIQSSIASAVALSTLLLAMSASILIISKVGDVSKSAIGTLAVMTAVIGALAGILYLLQDLPIQSTLANALALSGLMVALSTACLILGAAGRVGGNAVAGAAKLMAVVTVAGALLVAVAGLIDLIPGAEEFLDGGIKILEKIGYGLGSFIGSIAGGFSAGATSGLPEIGNNLSSFMENLKPFIEGTKNIDDSALDGVAKIGDMMLKLTGAGILDCIGKFINFGESPMKSFGEQLQTFGEAINLLLDTVSTMKPADAEKLQAVADIGNMFAALQSAVSPAGGLLQAIIGTKNLGNLGTQASQFVDSLKSVADSLQTIDDEGLSKVSAVAKAGKALTKLQEAVEPAGGLLQKLTGYGDMSRLGNEATSFVSSLTDIIQEVAKFNVSDLEKIPEIVKAGKALTKLQGAVEPANGFLQAVLGSKDLSVLGNQASAFITSLKSVTDDLKDVSDTDIEKVKSIANVGKALAKLQEAVEPAGGFLQAITGVKDISLLGSHAEEFVTSIAEVSKALAGENTVDTNAIKTAVNAGELLINLQNAIPKKEWFDGKVELDDFGKKIVTFGNSMTDFSNSVADIQGDRLTAVIVHAKELSDFAQDLSDFETEGIGKFKSIDSIGDAIKNYALKISDVNVDDIVKSVDSAVKLKALISGLSILNTNGVKKFDVKAIGESMKSYYDSVVGIDVVQIASSILSAEKLASLIERLATLNTSGVEKFKDAISSLGQAQIGDVSKTFSKASSSLLSEGNNMITSLTKGMSTKAGSAKTAATGIVSGIQSSITSRMSDFASLGAEMMTRLISGINGKTSSVSSTVNSVAATAASAIRNVYGSFYTNGGYLGDGLVSGINSKQTAVYNAGYELGQKAVQGEKDGQKSKSPSKLTIQAGKWLGEGLIVGTKAMGKKVYSAGYNMGETATHSISSAISKAGQLFGDSMDSEPTIRPVLDLSDVKNGATTLNGMFSNPLIAPTSNMRAISVMMKENSQNGNIDDVVSAVNKLRKDLGNVGNTYNSINGITYDNGSEISEAVGTLIRAARIERRR